MTDIMAGIGLAQLDKYQKLLSRRKEIIYKYNEGLKDLDVQILNHYDENHNSSGHLYLVRINGISGEQRNEIITEMAKKGIACNVHYKPLPLLTAYKKLGFDIKDYPNAYNQFINEKRKRSTVAFSSDRLRIFAASSCLIKDNMDMKKDRKRKKAKTASAVSVPVEATVSVSPSLQEGMQALQLLVDDLGGKWRIRVLWALLDGVSARYSIIKSRIPGITDMMLTQSLKELLQSGFISRQQFLEAPPRVEYQLTPYGQSLLPVIQQAVLWVQHHPKPETV